MTHNTLTRQKRLHASAGRWLAAAGAASLALVVFAVAGAGAASTRESAAAPSNTAAPTVSGTARAGATLTAETGDWSGDAPLAYAYQWQRCGGNGDNCTPLAGATSKAQVLVAADAGRALRVAVTATNGAGSATALSPTRGVVSPAGSGPASSAPATLSGTAQKGQTLTASSGTWTGTSPITFAYQWQRCDAGGGNCVDVAAATGQTRALTATDVASTVRVAVTATNTAGSGKAYSVPTAAVAGANAPVNTLPPAIFGTARQGEALTVSSGSWNGTQPITFGYQWKRCDTGGASCATIAGATTQTYVPVATDLGFTLRVSVTAANGAGSSSTLSNASGVVAAPGTAPANTTPPTISGSTTPGSTLTLSPGGWSGATPISFAYAWQRCDSNGNNCLAIGGAAQTFSVTVADVDHRLRGLITATNSVGSGGAYSAVTAVVAARAPINTVPPTVTGSAEASHTLTATTGSWAGASPISFSYQWARSNAQGGYTPIGGAQSKTYTVTSTDIGLRLLVQVKASNALGAAYVNSTPTGAVTGTRTPVNTTLPTIAGTPQVGATLTLSSTGAWSTPTPLTAVTQNWLRCDGAGNGCGAIPGGATAKSYKLTAADQGHTLRIAVTARNAAGSSAASSKQTGVVVPAGGGVTPPAGLPIGAVKLPGGKYSIPVSSVSLPARLVITGVSVTPSAVRSRTPFSARFRVTDTRGYAVRGALVYALGLPYGWVKKAPERATGNDGWVTVQLVPTVKLPLKKGNALVVFVRTRKPSDNLLAGVSSRRLVQVLLGAPLP